MIKRIKKFFKEPVPVWRCLISLFIMILFFSFALYYDNKFLGFISIVFAIFFGIYNPFTSKKENKKIIEEIKKQAEKTNNIYEVVTQMNNRQEADQTNELSDEQIIHIFNGLSDQYYFCLYLIYKKKLTTKIIESIHGYLMKTIIFETDEAEADIEKFAFAVGNYSGVFISILYFLNVLDLINPNKNNLFVIELNKTLQELIRTKTFDILKDDKYIDYLKLVQSTDSSTP